ncbi:MAG: SGNH/GDSL hydrolase family protein [Ruminococcaceae bacterium]|nr:SGNH/GDSL hydrolase family protein [Oscillospiraceae bacterium]
MMKIAFLGDSITFGYGLEHQDERYSSVVCRRLEIEEENYGITGTLIARAGMNRTDGKSFLDRLHLMEGADIAVVFGGTNDYFWSDRPIGTIDSADDYFAGAVERLCQTLTEMRKGKKTLLVTPYSHHGIGNFQGGETYQTSSEHDTTEINFNGHVLQDYVDSIVKIGEKWKIPVLNLHETPGFNWNIHTIDGCHPNQEGHLWLADQMEYILRGWL